MRYIFSCWLLVLFSGCTVTPEYCREWGVNVANDDIITGEVIEEHIYHWRKVKAKCKGNKYGCILAVNEHQYIIIRIDDTGAAAHEWCHAVYEEFEHVK